MAKLSRKDSRIRRHRRVRKNMFGTLDCPRFECLPQRAEIYAQVIDDKAGHTLVAASSIDQALREKVAGLTKTEQARLVGQLIGERAKQKGVVRVSSIAAVFAILAA